MSLIAIEGMEFYAYHGVYENEHKVGGVYVVDVYLETDFSEAAKNDDLNGTINYEAVFNICKSLMQQPVKLIEHLGYKIIEATTLISTKITFVKVRVSKIQPPLAGKVARTYVELERTLKK